MQSSRVNSPVYIAMPNKMNCPVCGSDMRSRNYLSLRGFRSYRVCPDCQAKYTTDACTKKRGLVIAAFAFITLGLSAAGFLIGPPWGLLAFFAGTGLLGYAGYVLSRMTYIEYRD